MQVAVTLQYLIQSWFSHQALQSTNDPMMRLVANVVRILNGRDSDGKRYLPGSSEDQNP